MKPSNAKELLAQEDIDGGLIGGAALNADSFFRNLPSSKQINKLIGNHKEFAKQTSLKNDYYNFNHHKCVLRFSNYCFSINATKQR